MFDNDSLAVMYDQFFLSEKLQRAVPFHVDGVSKITVHRWKHGDDRAALMVIGCFIDPIANRKLRHRELHLESSMRIISQIGLARLNQMNLIKWTSRTILIHRSDSGGHGSIPLP
jgi:hypothetical protein